MLQPGKGEAAWVTTGGQPVTVVHFTDHKPWQQDLSVPGHDLLC